MTIHPLCYGFESLFLLNARAKSCNPNSIHFLGEGGKERPAACQTTATTFFSLSSWSGISWRKEEKNFSRAPAFQKATFFFFFWDQFSQSSIVGGERESLKENCLYLLTHYCTCLQGKIKAKYRSASINILCCKKKKKKHHILYWQNLSTSWTDRYINPIISNNISSIAVVLMMMISRDFLSFISLLR